MRKRATPVTMMMMLSEKSANITAFYGASDNSGETSNAQRGPDDQAICHPLTLNSRTGVGRARRVILIIWISSAVSAFPWSVFAKVNYIQYEGHDLAQSAWCSMPFHEKDFDTTPLYFTIASTFLYFVVPFTIVFVLYLR